jgi:hypothetical protein
MSENIPYIERLVDWRSTSVFEVDFIIGDHIALEIKAEKNLSPNDVK